MEISEKIIIVGSVFAFFLGTVPYILKTLKGEIQPNRISWLLWTVPLIAVASQYQNHSLTYASVPIFLAGFGPLLVFIATFFNKKAYWKLENFDYICLFFGILTVFLYLLSQNPVLVILFAIFTDFLGGILTIKKAYTHPKSEDIGVYIVFLPLCVISFFTMERFDFEEMAFPSYLLLYEIIMVYLLRGEISGFFKKFISKQ